MRKRTMNSADRENLTYDLEYEIIQHKARTKLEILVKLDIDNKMQYSTQPP